MHGRVRAGETGHGEGVVRGQTHLLQLLHARHVGRQNHGEEIFKKLTETTFTFGQFSSFEIS